MLHYPNVTILDASTVGNTPLYGLVALLESVVILGMIVSS
jgi:hypothetical protein